MAPSSSILGVYTGFFEFFGLGSPFTRFLFGTALGFAGQLLLKPKLSYHSNGAAKEFLSETYTPWYVLSVLPGLIFSLVF